METQRGFFDEDERLATLSALGDPLEKLNRVVDFVRFRRGLDPTITDGLLVSIGLRDGFDFVGG